MFKPKRPQGHSKRNRNTAAAAASGITEPAQVGLPRFLNLDPFPPIMHRKLAYSQVVRLTSGSGGLSGTSQVFRANSLYDPDLTGTGHQPYGFDQLCSATGPYSRYKVCGAVITARVTAPALDDGVWVAVAIHNPGSSATIAGLSLDTIAEKHNTKVMYISGTGEQEKVHTIKMPNLATYCNLTKQQFDTDKDNFTAAYNGNPGSVLRVEYTAVEPFVDSVGVTLLVNIEYDATFYTRNQLTQS